MKLPPHQHQQHHDSLVPGRGWILAVLAGLSTLALAQPVLELLCRSPQFLLAHQLSNSEIVLLVGCLLTVPPLLLWGLVLCVGYGSPDRRLRVLGLVALVLSVVSVSPSLGRGLPVTGWLQICLALTTGGLLTFLLARSQTLRPHLNLLGWVPLLVAALFFMHPGSRSVFFVHHTNDALAEAETLPTADPGTPVVFVVFDALPVISLMDGENRIDNARFPNFARLADDAVWYRNTLSIGDDTMWVVPTILTGLAPRRNALPLSDWHPNNLFSWLSASRPVFAFESATRLSKQDSALSTSKRWRLTISDISCLFLHILVPENLAGGLPPISHDWKNFAGGNPGNEGAEHSGSDRLSIFQSYLDSFVDSDPAGCFFLHSILPHTPYYFMPSGAAYTADKREPGGEGLQWDEWSDDRQAILQSQQRHLLQTGYVDCLLGQIIDRLTELEIYEKSLIVVTADHGVSFRPGATRRKFSRVNPGDILAVPLLIKYPGAGESRIDERVVRITDILPTVAAALGTTLPWATTGSSVLDSTFTGHETVTYFGKKLDLELQTEDVLNDRATSLRQRIADFGEGSDLALLHAPGPGVPLLGKPVPARPAVFSGVRLSLIDPGRREVPEPGTGRLPAVARGIFQGNSADAGRLAIAVAIDGTVRAITRPHEKALADEQHVWSILLPESSLPPGIHFVEAFLVDHLDDTPVLFASDQLSAATEREHK